MAAPCAQHGLGFFLEFSQDVQGDKGLSGAGKAAAMYPDSSPALQNALAKGQSYHQLLMGGLPGRNNILEVHGGGPPRFLHQR